MKINVLIDNHLPVDLDAYPLPELDRAALYRFLADLRPQRITAFAYGHDGWAQYRSALNASPPGMPLDLLDFWRKLAVEVGCAFAVYVSTLINHRLLRTEPTWERTGLESNSTHRLDHASPYLDAWLKPVLAEIIERYGPEGFFFDGDYWTVGESLSPTRAPAAERLFPHFHGSDLSSLSADEHRRLTLHTYGAYLADLAAFLLPRTRKNCVNLAFSLRHPSDRLPGLALTTSDLPPFFAVLDCWLETAVMQGHDGEREVLVPLFVEPEGGGRKYTKTLPQVVQEIAPIIAMNESIHVYFPLNIGGRLDTSYLSLLLAVKEEVDRVAPHAFDEAFVFRPDVICLADTDLLARTQDFAHLRGAALLASVAGMNMCIANTSRCMAALQSARLLLAPDILSASAEVCLAEARRLNVAIVREDFAGANQMITHARLETIKRAYTEGPPNWFASFTIHRPPCAFVRASRSEEARWRLFIFNSCEVGSALGRHVMSQGAGHAGRLVVTMPANARFDRIEGYAEDVVEDGAAVAFDLVGAFVIVDGHFA